MLIVYTPMRIVCGFNRMHSRTGALSDQQQDQVIQTTEAWIQEASRLYRRVFPKIDVRFDLRGRTSGIFCVRRNRCFIRYNSAIFKHYFQESLNQTVPHEVAHYVVHMLHGQRAKPHGIEWKTVMRDFKVPAEVRSSLDVSDLSTRTLQRFPYRCGCREHQLTSIRHNRILRGDREYKCTKCHKKLLWITPDPSRSERSESAS